MTNPKDTLKQLGDTMRSSNDAHRALLRARLEAQAGAQDRASGWDWRRYLVFAASAASLVLVVFIIGPNSPGVVTRSMVNVAEDSADIAFESDDLLSDSFSDEAGFANADGFFDRVTSTSHAPGKPNKHDTRDVIDYENEHGQMLEKTTRIGLMTKEDDLLTDVERLFNSFGGHISGISDSENKTVSDVSEIFGYVPADSYFLFREQLRELVKADKYMYEYLDANDLIPSAMTLDENIAELNTAISGLRQQITETADPAAKASLENQLRIQEKQLANLQDSREDLDDRVSYVQISVQIWEVPGFWETRWRSDLQHLVAGYGAASLPEQAWINMLFIGFRALQVISWTFWLLIPLAIWLIYRRRQRLAWRELE